MRIMRRHCQLHLSSLDSYAALHQDDRQHDTWTKHQLFQLLATKGSCLVSIRGVTGTLSAIQREDGSGSSFNVTLHTSSGPQTVYVRTID